MESSTQWTCLGKLQDIVKAKETWCVLVHGVTESDMTQQLKNKYWRENPKEMQINYI